MARARSLLAASGARLDLARSTLAVGEIELAAGDPAAAERCFRGYKAFRAMGERGYCSTEAGLLAEALYRQGRLGEAQQMTEEATRGGYKGCKGYRRGSLQKVGVPPRPHLGANQDGGQSRRPGPHAVVKPNRSRARAGEPQVSSPDTLYRID
jgi:hypothetical protein